ncbi:MAG TPA: hypothetical protein PKK99_06785 [Bacteroidia bacterium]|nr:hypothetical protein [Bacteroidia bacterium]
MFKKASYFSATTADSDNWSHLTFATLIYKYSSYAMHVIAQMLCASLFGQIEL